MKIARRAKCSCPVLSTFLPLRCWHAHPQNSSCVCRCRAFAGTMWSHVASHFNSSMRRTAGMAFAASRHKASDAPPAVPPPVPPAAS
eukprot:1291628-Pleurochrysis_carterae.AAC.1